ncbi:unnamed protein product [Camellia sinensis]
MEKGKKSYSAHVLAIPYPSQGHINPLLQLCKRLVSKGLIATFALTTFISNSIHHHHHPPQSNSSLQFDTISDGCDQAGFPQAGSVQDYLARLEAAGSQTLAELIRKYGSSDNPIDCIIYDAYLPWALDVAKQFSLAGATFFTQPCAVDYIYYYVHHGLMKLPVESSPVSIPGLPLLELQDMPSFIYVHGSYPAYFELVLNQFSNVDKADYVTCQYLLPVRGSARNFLIPVNEMGTFCFAFAASASGLSIIGNIQQEGIQISFDGANGFVGFGPNVC